MRTLKDYLIYEWGIDPTTETDDDRPDDAYEDLFDHLKNVKHNEYVFDPQESELELYPFDKKSDDYACVEKIYLSKNKKEILFDIRIIVDDKPTKKITGLTWDDLFTKKGKYYGNRDFEDFYEEFYRLVINDKGWYWTIEHWYDEPDPPEWDD